MRRNERSAHRWAAAILLALAALAPQPVDGDEDRLASPDRVGISATLLEDGSYVAVRAAGQALLASFFDARGALLRDDVVVAETEGRRAAIGPALVALAGTELLVLWTSEPPATAVSSTRIRVAMGDVTSSASGGSSLARGAEGQLFGRRFLGDGTALTRPFPVATEGFSVAGDVAAVAMPDGGVLVVWRSSTHAGAPTSLVGRLIGVDGVPRGAARLLHESRHSLTRLAVAAGEQDGILVWSEVGEIWALALTAEGEPLGPAFPLGDRSSRDPLPSVAGAGGEYLTAWYEQPATGASRIAARWIGASGAQGPSFVVSEEAAPREAAPAVAVDQPGEFRIAWTAAPSGDEDGAEGAMAVVHLKRSGSAVARPLRLGPAEPSGGTVAVLGAAAGEFVLAWESAPGERTVLRTRLSPPGEAGGAEGLRRIHAAITEPTGTPGTCFTAECERCRSVGWSDAHDQCVYWTVGSTGSYRSAYRYTGATEGHDGAANLLMYKGDGIDDVCNVSKGSCCKSDSGCPLGIGGCSGSSRARVCRSYEQCAGAFLGSANNTGGWDKLGFTGALVLVYGGKPYDCDCTSGVEGRGGSFGLWVKSDGTIDGVSIGGPLHPNSDAGTISGEGTMFDVQTHKALTCGTYYDGLGCSAVSRQIERTPIDSRQFSSGNPFFTIASTCP
jgi:hypothetical protein